MWPVRAAPEFVATVYATVPVAVPAAPVVMVIQDASAEAVQLQPEPGIVTVALNVPPPCGTDCAVVESANAHDGLVVVEEVELDEPQAVAKISRKTPSACRNLISSLPLSRLRLRHEDSKLIASTDRTTADSVVAICVSFQRELYRAETRPASSDSVLRSLYWQTTCTSDHMICRFLVCLVMFGSARAACADSIQDSIARAAGTGPAPNTVRLLICANDVWSCSRYEPAPANIALPLDLRRAGAGVALTIRGANISIARSALKVTKSVTF